MLSSIIAITNIAIITFTNVPQKFAFEGSKDLRVWTRLSVHGRTWETNNWNIIQFEVPIETNTWSFYRIAEW